MSSPPAYYAGLVPRSNEIQCQTAREADFYGLGVRLGIYFAWLQAYIANIFLPDEIAGAADTNTLFLLVLLVAMIKCSSVNMLEQIDGLILMHLSGGFTFGIFSIWGYRTRQYVDNGVKAIRFFGGFGTHSRLIVSLMVSIYGLWFWIYGVTGSLVFMSSPEEVGSLAVDPPNPPECAILYTFMFAKVRADSGIRIFYIITCIGCSVYFGTMLLASGIAGWARVNKMIELSKQKRWADSSKVRFATGFKYRELEVIFKYLRVLNFLWLIYSALLIEFSLSFNNMSAVLGGTSRNELQLPAQLLPLLIGAGGLLRSLYLLFQSWRAGGDAEPSLSDPPPRRARTMHLRDIPFAFSPAMARDSVIVSHDPNEVDEIEGGRSWPVRYLVAWLPWLSLLKYFHDEPMKSNKWKRLSDDSELSQLTGMTSAKRSPRQGLGIEGNDYPESSYSGAAVRQAETF